MQIPYYNIWCSPDEDIVCAIDSCFGLIHACLCGFQWLSDQRGVPKGRCHEPGGERQDNAFSGGWGRNNLLLIHCFTSALSSLLLMVNEHEAQDGPLYCLLHPWYVCRWSQRSRRSVWMRPRSRAWLCRLIGQSEACWRSSMRRWWTSNQLCWRQLPACVTVVHQHICTHNIHSCGGQMAARGPNLTLQQNLLATRQSWGFPFNYLHKPSHYFS